MRLRALKMAEMYPERVEVIYIICIGGRKKNKRLERLAEDASDLGSEMLTVRATTGAAQHAIEKGYITASGLEEIENAKKSGRGSN